MTEEIRAKVDEYAQIMVEKDRLQERADELKAYFMREAEACISGTKLKNSEFWGTENAKVSVTTAETVKPVSITMVRNLLGGISADFITEKVSYEMTAPCKKLFGAVFQGNYTEGSLKDLIRSLSDDPKITETLQKRLKGNFERDKATLMKVAGLDEQTAADNAYLAAEVLNWEWLLQVLKAADWKGTVAEAISIIKAAVLVDESITVKVAKEG